MPHAEFSHRDVTTRLPYIARNKLYLYERPYGVDFSVDHFEDAKPSNHLFDVQPVTIQDVRSRGIDNFNLDVNGFCYIKAATSLTAADALAAAPGIKPLYFEEIEAILHEHFPQYSRFECMDLITRKRDPAFPNNVGAVVTHEQPAGIPHTDFSVTGAFSQMEGAFPGQKMYYENKSFDLLKCVGNGDIQIIMLSMLAASDGL
ncbi:hypothetical protein MMC17_008896 [Xylographa soralifera]|nr:hypothetical protein [Xylographa soralifera]